MKTWVRICKEKADLGDFRAAYGYAKVAKLLGNKVQYVLQDNKLVIDTGKRSCYYNVIPEQLGLNENKTLTRYLYLRSLSESGFA